MKKLLVIAASIFALAVPATASAVYYDPGGDMPNYCFPGQQGQVAQGRSGAWYRCTWTGNGYTGYQWWRIG